MSRKRKKLKLPKNPNCVFHMSSIEATRAKMPHYNAYQIGHGIHGDTKYNRRKFKAETRRIIRDESSFLCAYT